MNEIRKRRSFVVLAAAAAAAVFFASAGVAAAASAMGKGKFVGMVRIPAGPFTMGRNGGPPDERPGHTVRLPVYYIDKNLVTWAQYAEFIQAKGPSGPKGEMYLDVYDDDTRIVIQKGK